MEIEIKKTTELTHVEWNTYIQSFNQVFHKTFNINDFKHKYINTIDGFSYHSLLKEGENGFLASTENEWFEKLSKLIDSFELRKQIGIEGRKTVEQFYSVESQKNNFLSLFKTN